MPLDKKRYNEIVSKLPHEKWCPAPFVHGYMNANNRGIKLCCMSKIVDRFDGLSDLGKQYDDFWRGEQMQEIRRSFMEDGKMPEPCEWYCGRYEDLEVYEESQRVSMLNKYRNYLWHDDDPFGDNTDKGFETLEFNIEEGNKYGRPLDIDLRPGKLCNLKCRSCCTVWSTEIEKEVLNNPEIQGEEWYWDTITTSPTHMRLIKTIDWDDPNLDLLKSINLDNVKWLKMSGGETLIDPSVYKLWQRVVDSGHAKHLSLHLITNITTLPSRAVNLIKEFKEVTINMSVDATGPLQEIVRKGAKWDKNAEVFHRIFQEIPNLKWAGTNTVCQVSTIFDIKEWATWIMDNGMQYDQKFSQINFLPIVEPLMICIGWLDDDHREQIRADLDWLCERYKDYPRFLSNIRKCYSELDRYVDADPKVKEDLGRQFIRHQVALDRIRDEKLYDVVPQLKRYFERYDESAITEELDQTKDLRIKYAEALVTGGASDKVRQEKTNSTYAGDEEKVQEYIDSIAASTEPETVEVPADDLSPIDKLFAKAKKRAENN